MCGVSAEKIIHVEGGISPTGQFDSKLICLPKWKYCIKHNLVKPFVCAKDSVTANVLNYFH